MLTLHQGLDSELHTSIFTKTFWSRHDYEPILQFEELREVKQCSQDLRTGLLMKHWGHGGIWQISFLFPAPVSGIPPRWFLERHHLHEIHCEMRKGAGQAMYGGGRLPWRERPLSALDSTGSQPVLKSVNNITEAVGRGCGWCSWWQIDFRKKDMTRGPPLLVRRGGHKWELGDQGLREQNGGQLWGRQAPGQTGPHLCRDCRRDEETQNKIDLLAHPDPGPQPVPFTQDFSDSSPTSEGLPGTDLVSKPKVLCPRNPLNSEQMRTVGHPARSPPREEHMGL